MPTSEPPPAGEKHEQWSGLPSQTAFALFDDEPRAAKAAERLQKTGVDAHSVRILSGEEGAATLRPGATQGAPDFVTRAIRELTDETRYIDSYIDAIREGRSLLAAGFESVEEREKIEAILLDSGGDKIAYTSDWTLTVVGSGRKSSDLA